MKGRSPLYAVALGLVGILVISTAIIALGSRETRAFPSAESFRPSGTSAFAELLRQSGYQVVIDRRKEPRVQPGDLVIAFNVTAPILQSFITNEADEEQLQATKESIATFVEDGGRVLSLPISPSFGDESKELYDSEVLVTSNTVDADVTWDQVESIGFYIEGGDISNAIQTWGADPERDEDESTPFVMLKAIGDGKEANLANGIVATNRFIDRQENALVLMDTVRALAPPGSRVVFAEATFGNAKDPGLLETIGPWAVAAWAQLLFLGAVVIYTLGKPFGLPDFERRKERGTRDLMDAMANTLQRGRMTKLALRTVLDDTNRFLRKLYRGKRDPSGADLQANNMADLQRALNRVEAAIEIGAPEDMAAKMIREVETLAKEAGSRGTSTY